MQTSAIRHLLLDTAGVQSVGSVDVHELENGGRLVTARLGFGPSMPTAEIVAVLGAARTRLRAAEPDLADVVLEPEVAAPRDDANPPTDVFVIRGAD